MRYVMLAVAIGLLVVGGAAYARAATQGKPAVYDSRLLFAPERRSVAELRQTALQAMQDRQQSVYAAQIQQLQQEQAQKLARQQAQLQAQQQEQQRQQAIADYGQWGPDLLEAARTYGQDPGDLYRVMICESKGDPYASNGINEGLFQFNPGTWAGTPYGGQSIYDGHAQIMAAAWMWSQGRQGEWSCY